MLTHIPWKSIKTVLLDLDGTLLDLHYDNTFWHQYLPECYAQKHNLPLEAAKTKVSAFAEVVRGTLPWYCIDAWSDELGLDVLALKQDLKHLIKPRPYTQELLTWLKAADHQVLLVTNAHPKSLDIKLACVPLTHYFDAIVSSHLFGLPKENTHFWPKLHTLYPFDPQHTLLIDDNVEVLRSAKQHDIQHLHAVLQPDLKRPARAIDEFPGILHFSDIIPQVFSLP